MPREHNYILDENNIPVPEPDLSKWAEWMETHERQVKRDYRGDLRISTVFLGIDHNFVEEGDPIVFETTVFPHNSWDDQWSHRCSTWEDALVMHEAGVAWATVDCISREMDIKEGEKEVIEDNFYKPGVRKICM